MLFLYRWIPAAFACCAVLAYADPQPGSRSRTNSKRADPCQPLPNVLKEYNYAEQVTAMSDPANLMPVPGADRSSRRYAGKAVPNASNDLKDMLTKTRCSTYGDCARGGACERKVAD